METITYIEKYLNFGVKEDLVNILTGSNDNLKQIENTEYIVKKIEEINNYQTIYKQKIETPEKVNDYLMREISNYIDLCYNNINNDNVDINYYLNSIYINYGEKFHLIIEKMNIKHIIKMLDYTNENKKENNFKFLMNTYIKLFYEKILLGQYGKTKKHLYELIDDNWILINMKDLINFTDILSKLTYYKIDTSIYDSLFNTKFNNVSNIQKLLQFINKSYLCSDTTTDITDVNEADNKDFLKFNLKYIITNLKSNGFLLFEEYFKDIQQRYETINIFMLNKDLKLITHFILIIVNNEDTKVNRHINEMLIRIRNYLFDLEESYYNNKIYKKISIRADSEKYKNENLSIFNREISNFKVLKYNYCINSNNILARAHTINDTTTNNDTNNLVIDYKNISKKLAGYFDIYHSYYKTRYPDREIEYDLINSTMIVKMIFSENPYYIHLALIQYIILDKIIEKENGISVHEISETLDIPLEYLNDTFNSLLKIKLVKRSVEPNIKFILNKDFSYNKNKLSISGLVKKEITKQIEREFLLDRDMIVFCNLIHYTKKNTYFSRDTIIEELSYKIPFKLTDEYIDNAIKKAIEEEYIKVKEINNNNAKDLLFEYNNE
jgi:hypothetical protein